MTEVLRQPDGRPTHRRRSGTRERRERRGTACARGRASCPASSSSGWKVVTLDATAGVEKQPEGGYAFRIDATPNADTTILCMNGEVAIDGPVVLRGRWRAEKLKPGLRAQVRYFTGAPVAEIREVAWVSDASWADFAGVADVPKGTTRVKTCFLVQGTGGTAWLDDLYFGPATPDDIARAQGRATGAAAVGPTLPEPWIPVPASLPAEGRAGPIDGVPGAFFVTGPLIGEGMACDNTPRPSNGEVTLTARLDASNVKAGGNPNALPRIQVRGMAEPGGAAVTVLDTLVATQDGLDQTLTGTVSLPKEVPYDKLCVMVRTYDTRVAIKELKAESGK